MSLPCPELFPSSVVPPFRSKLVLVLVLVVVLVLDNQVPTGCRALRSRGKVPCVPAFSRAVLGALCHPKVNSQPPLSSSRHRKVRGRGRGRGRTVKSSALGPPPLLRRRVLRLGCRENPTL